MNEVIYNPLHFIGKNLLQINNRLHDRFTNEYYSLEFNSKSAVNYGCVIYLEALLEGKKHGFLLKEPRCASAYLMYTLYMSNGKKIYFTYCTDNLELVKVVLTDFNLSYTNNRIL